MKKLEVARKILAKSLNRKYGYGYAWDWNTVLDASGTEDFNEPLILRKGECFLDVGAAWGFWTVRAAEYYDQVISFEPDPRLYPQLCRNVRINNLTNVLTLPFAAGDQEASHTTFFRYGKGESSLLHDHMGLKTDGEPFHVPQTTIDAIVRHYDLKPSVIKLDVEGAELQVLKGASDTLIQFKPSLLVEVHHPTETSQIEVALPFYHWETRWRYLNRKVYPMDKQAHLLGT